MFNKYNKTTQFLPDQLCIPTLNRQANYYYNETNLISVLHATVASNVTYPYQWCYLPYLLPLIPPSLIKQKVLHQAHNIPSAGHQGYHKTPSHLKEEACWPGMAIVMCNSIVKNVKFA